jgi:DNA polymerase-3 subunit alpha
LQRHDIPEQNIVNEVLIKFALKHNVKIIASNDSHYVNQEDANAHDILLCINTGEKQSTPTMKEFSDDDVNVRGKRFAFFNDQFYFKKTEEMSKLFSDLPEAIDNTNEIVGKVEMLKLKQDILLPHFTIPEGFNTQDEYLHHLTYSGALNRYGQLTPEIEERLNFELFTIKTMGFAGYFLIVADFIKAGREIGVFVGPGRGSAAGSAVAYCIGITNIDPLKYNLLFERFLNPDRKSMPDIDTDFDDLGRQKVIDYVVDKYGKTQVAQIVTFGTMAAKMSIKDVARVLELPLPDSNAMAKLVPDKPGIVLNRVLTAPLEGDKSLKDKEGLNSDDLELVKKLRAIAEGDDLRAKVLKEAMILEGSVRNTGIHAAGIIIAPRDLYDIIPVATSKDSDLLVTQYEGKIIEDAGVIKMDFLGLKTLTIIKDALNLIKENHGVTIDIDTIPLDDKKTLELYQRAETNATFQFESAGMQKYLRDLKPDKFEDLIAMNALFRPGPLAYIPSYINRKHGREVVTYDLDDMKEYLEETNGITVYQEQVMLLSQKIAGFTKGEADILRKAMGKKDRKTLDKLKPQFIEQAGAKGHDQKVLEKIWTDWEAFASYAFNKSHSTCYAFVAFQTAYLKAHYPAEYMAAVMTNNLSQIEKITFFLEECRRMGLTVLGPDVNESAFNFTVNKQGQIRFGLVAVKGVGDSAVDALAEERKNNGPFTNVFDLCKRVPGRLLNKRTLESMALGGAFDCFTGTHRAQYFQVDPKDGLNGLEKAVRYGAAMANDGQQAQASLFDDTSDQDIAEPQLPNAPEWSKLELLKKEKEVVGFYISGHPLDGFRFEINQFCNTSVEQLNRIDELKNRDITFPGIIVDVEERMTKSGKPFGFFNVEDFTGNYRLALFGEDYGKFKHLLVKESLVFVRARVQTRFANSTDLEIKITGMEFLKDAADKMVKMVNLKMRLRDVQKGRVDMIESLLKDHQGKTPFKIQIYDLENGVNLGFESTKFRVKVNAQLLDELKELTNGDISLA